MEVIITGTGSGIGKALAEYYLQAGCRVVGISRKNDILHANFHFVKMDLLQVESFSFLKDVVSYKGELTVINNAGMLGNMERISQQVNTDIDEVMQLNAIVPMRICQEIMRNMPPTIPLTIVNISSGAGKRPVSGWASYCASKAAIDLFSQTLLLEELELGRNFKVYSVAPGVVDTAMQSSIRSTSKSNFSGVEQFIQYKNEGILYSVEQVTEKIAKMLGKEYTNDVIQSLRDY